MKGFTIIYVQNKIFDNMDNTDNNSNFIKLNDFSEFCYTTFNATSLQYS